MDHTNHYEAAFEAYLRQMQVRYVSVDEARRAVVDGGTVKSADFIVVGPDTAQLVVDVKGRKFPGGTPERPRKTWQNWSETDDVDGLDWWAGSLGPGFRGILAFVYHIVPPFAVYPGTPDRFSFRDRTYLMRAVASQDYRPVMRPRSKSWGTVHLPTAEFRRLVRPFSDFLERK